jgi:hypothetical protein
VHILKCITTYIASSHKQVGTCVAPISDNLFIEDDHVPETNINIEPENVPDAEDEASEYTDNQHSDAEDEASEYIDNQQPDAEDEQQHDAEHDQQPDAEHDQQPDAGDDPDVDEGKAISSEDDEAAHIANSKVQYVEYELSDIIN